MEVMSWMVERGEITHLVVRQSGDSGSPRYHAFTRYRFDGSYEYSAWAIVNGEPQLQAGAPNPMLGELLSVGGDPLDATPRPFPNTEGLARKEQLARGAAAMERFRSLVMLRQWQRGDTTADDVLQQAAELTRREEEYENARNELERAIAQTAISEAGDGTSRLGGP